MWAPPPLGGSPDQPQWTHRRGHPLCFLRALSYSYLLIRLPTTCELFEGRSPVYPTSEAPGPRTVHGTWKAATDLNQAEFKERRPHLTSRHFSLPACPSTLLPACLHACLPAPGYSEASLTMFPSRQPRMITVLSWVLFLLCVCVLSHHIEMQTARC